MTVVSIVALTVLAGVAAPVAAQSAQSDQAGASRTNLVSTNPIGVIFEWFNGEFEHALNSTSSLAVAATRFDFEEFNYTAIDGIARYYPSARAIRGFSIGGSVGALMAADDNCTSCDDVNENAFTIGVRGDHVWILGRDQRFAVAAGLGAKRLFFGDGENSASTFLPIGRLSIGYAW